MPTSRRCAECVGATVALPVVGDKTGSDHRGVPSSPRASRGGRSVPRARLERRASCRRDGHRFEGCGDVGRRGTRRCFPFFVASTSFLSLGSRLPTVTVGTELLRSRSRRSSAIHSPGRRPCQRRRSRARSSAGRSRRRALLPLPRSRSARSRSSPAFFTSRAGWCLSAHRTPRPPRPRRSPHPRARRQALGALAVSSAIRRERRQGV